MLYINYSSVNNWWEEVNTFKHQKHYQFKKRKKEKLKKNTLERKRGRNRKILLGEIRNEKFC